MASRFTIGESSKFLKLIFLPICKEDYIIKGLKTESNIYLLPSKANNRCFNARQTCMEGPIKEIIKKYPKINK